MRHRRYSYAGAFVASIVGLATWLVPASPAAAAATITIDRTSIDFGNQRVGTFGAIERVVVTANGDAPVDIEDVTLDGGNANLDFVGDAFDESASYCWDGAVTLAPTESCVIDIVFFPGERGLRTAKLTVDTSGNDPTTSVKGTGTVGYYIGGTAGQVANFGDADDLGDVSHLSLNSPIVGMATTPNGEGFWLAAADGGVFAFGNAGFYGSKGGQPLNQPIVGMASTSDGGGYWLVAADGGIFTFGNAPFLGSKGGQPLNRPIVAMAADPWGGGYWMVASDGGIFTFGDAGFFGSKGGQPLNQPVVGMASTPTGEGYHLVALDGGIFTFGDAEFHGSKGGQPLNSPMVGMAGYPTGHGYWTVARDGGVFTFGPTTPFMGSLGGQGIDDVVTMAGTAQPGLAGLLGIAGAGDGGPVKVQPRELPAHRRVVG